MTIHFTISYTLYIGKGYDNDYNGELQHC